MLVALGNTQLKAYHALLCCPGTRHEDLDPDYYERQATTRRQFAHHVGKLAALGFEVTLARISTADSASDPAWPQPSPGSANAPPGAAAPSRSPFGASAGSAPHGGLLGRGTCPPAATGRARPRLPAGGSPAGRG
jgi:hypothetical protein